MDDLYLALTLGVGAAGLAATWFAFRGKAVQLEDIYSVPVARIKKIYLYPFKSCHGIEIQSSDCLKRGLKYDRYLY